MEENELKETTAAAAADNGERPSPSKTEAAEAVKKTKAEKTYSTAFRLMTGIVVLLFVVFVGSRFLERAALKNTEFYRTVLDTSAAAVPEKQMPEQESDAVPVVNINTASAVELTKLPGIGEKRAADIVAYRNEYGRFTEPEDLLKISGIGPALLEKIRPYITLEVDP